MESTAAATAAPTTTVPPATEVPVAEAQTESAATEAPATEAPPEPADAPSSADPLSLLGEIDAVERTVSDESGWSQTYSYALPCIHADTEGARAINADIENNFGETFRYVKEHLDEVDASDLLSLKYYGVVWEDVLTVVISQYLYYDWTDYTVYCYETSTGRWLTTSMLLAKMGVSEEAFLDACRDRFRERLIESYQTLPEDRYEEFGFPDMLTAQTSDQYVNLDLMAYPENGDLVAVAPILCIAGPAYCYTKVYLGLGGPLSLLGEASFEEGEYTDMGGNEYTYSYAIPCILADTEGARAINQAIDDYFGAIVRDEKAVMEEQCSLIDTAISYTGHVWEEILTVDLFVQNEWGCNGYGIYCYSTSTGEWLTTAMLLERMGITQEEFLDACRASFRQTFIDQNHLLSEEQRANEGYDEALERAASDCYVNMDLKAYPDVNGKLVVIAPIVSLAGADFYYQVLHLDLGAES
jgi:hypothetical protein